MQTIFFFYGLAFLLMGIVIFMMPKKNDPLGLSRDLWLVGLFGIFHGVNEWVDLLILRGSSHNVAMLTVFGALLLPLSFVPLLQFGIRTLFRETRSFRSLKYLGVIALAGWAVACFLTSGFLIPGVVARYFIGFPGTILAAAGLFKVFWKSDKEKLPMTVSVGALGAVIFFVFYGILTGLVVPRASFLLASSINYPNFLQITGLPVQFLRMIFAILLAASFFAVAGIYAFNPENKKVIRRGGIQRKVTWVLCGFNSAAALLIACFVFVWSYQAMLTNLKQEQLKTSKLLSQFVNEMMAHEVDDLQVHLSNNAWRQVVEEANLRYGAMSSGDILKYMQEMDKRWIPAKRDSAFIRSYLETPMSLRLKSLDEADRTVAEIFLTDRFGGLVAASEKTSDFYQADEDWWQKAYAGGKGSVFLGNVELDESSGVLSAPMAVPIRNENGEVIGIAKESVGVDTFFSVLKSYRYGKTGHAAIIDDKGSIVFYENIKPLSMKLLNREEMQGVVQNKIEEIGKTEGTPRKTALFISAERVNSPLLLSNGIVWYLCILQDSAEVLHPLKQLFMQMAALLLILLAIGIFSGIILGNRFARPIRELQKAVGQIMAGDMNYRINILTRDEIQEFAESFDALIQQLQERQAKLLGKTEEIEALSHGLEKKVEERTKELSDGQRATMNILEDLTKTKEELEVQSWGLQKANDGIMALYQELEKKNQELEKLGQLKNDFVSIVAHELRNPLGVVREAAALILDGLVGPISEEQGKYIEMIRRTGDRLIHITNDLLDLAKIEAGKIVVNFEEIDLLSMVRQACEGTVLRSQKKGLTVSQDLPDGKLEISGDFDKLSQVMINLLSNAFKFTEKGGITVEVKDLGEEVRCAVKDTGPGISQENLSRLFSKFEQFGKPTTSSEKGSGLGLVISKSIIEAHGGRMGAESQLGKGSAFFFVLPKRQQQK